MEGPSRRGDRGLLTLALLMNRASAAAPACGPAAAAIFGRRLPRPDPPGSASSSSSSSSSSSAPAPCAPQVPALAIAPLSRGARGGRPPSWPPFHSPPPASANTAKTPQNTQTHPKTWPGRSRCRPKFYKSSLPLPKQLLLFNGRGIAVNALSGGNTSSLTCIY